MAYKGKYTPKNPEKYKGNVNNIVWRSTWERRFLRWLDETPAVIEYASEEITVPYYSPLDGKMHRYYIDFYMKIKDKDGKISTYLIEIKPYKQTQPPKEGKRRTKKFLRERARYIINQCKWNAARKFAEHNKVKFLILTEKTLYNME